MDKIENTAALNSEEVLDSDTGKGVHMELLKKRVANLLAIKSLVTLIVTAVFAVLALRGSITGDQFLTVFTVVVSFYFGTQHAKEGA